MRWPILIQILVPMLAVVATASLLAGAGSAYLGGLQAEAERAANLDRVVQTLADGGFPLTRRVLEQLTGLSGAEFVFFDDEGSLRESTVRWEPVVRDELQRIAADAPPPRGTHRPKISLDGRVFAADRVRVSGRTPSGDSGTLLVLYPQEPWSGRIRRAAYPALAAGTAAALLAMATAALLARRLVRPIHLLAAQTARIAEAASLDTPTPRGPLPAASPPQDGRCAGDPLSGGLPFNVSFSAFRRNDELRDLALSIHRMSQRLAAYEDEIRKSERLQTLDRMGAALGHQLRNAATGAAMAIEFHRRDCPEGAGDESLDVARRQLRLMESYLERFLAVDREHRAAPQRVCVGAVVDDVLALTGPLAKHAGVDVSVAPSGEPLYLRGDVEAMRQLATNLLTNAIEAAQGRPDGRGRVEVALLRRDDGRGALELRDNGPGPDPAVSRRLFEAFASAKRDGVGLGLWLARRIAEAHGGSLQWQRRGDITVFAWDFPLTDGAPHGAPADRG